MSALGQKQTHAVQQRMSALPPIATVKADIRKRACLLYPRKRTHAVQQRMSALGQKRTSATLFDHLVGIRKEGGWYVETECFGGGQVNGQIEFGRLLDRNIARFRPAQNLIDILGGVPELSNVVWSVGH